MFVILQMTLYLYGLYVIRIFEGLVLYFYCFLFIWDVLCIIRVIVSLESGK